jgi:hypothetical protein
MTANPIRFQSSKHLQSGRASIGDNALRTKGLKSRLDDLEKRKMALQTSLSTVLDFYSLYIIVWKLCTTMKAEDVMTS